MTSELIDAAARPRWSAREQEFLTITLRLLQEHGYDRLTVDEVAAEAKASKATLYRRWPSKTDLVVAAFIEGVRIQARPPNTGSLREDLLAIGGMICATAGTHAPTVRAVLNEISRTPALREAMQTEFLDERHALFDEVLEAAVRRGEINADAVNPELWNVLPGYLVFRFLLPTPPPDAETVRALVDEVVLPSLTRKT